MTNVRVYTGKLYYDGSYTDTFQWVKLDDVRSELERLRNKVAALTIVAYGTPENPRSPVEPEARHERAMNLLRKYLDREFNPFEPNNQSATYKELSEFLYPTSPPNRTGD